jgi:hypothetical protein
MFPMPFFPMPSLQAQNRYQAANIVDEKIADKNKGNRPDDKQKYRRTKIVPKRSFEILQEL